MKKNILAFTAAFSLAVLFSGCNNSEEGPSELDKLLEQLQTTHLTSDVPEDAESDESAAEGTTYRSVTGVLVSFTEKEITVKAEDKEQSFIISGDTQILGGALPSADAVTVTYDEDDENEKGPTALIITVLNAGEDAELSDAPSEADTEEASADGEVDPSDITPSEESASDTEETEEALPDDSADAAPDGTEAAAAETDDTAEAIGESENTEPSEEETGTSPAEPMDESSDTEPDASA
ncbi:MAG: hypothetical protein NC394_06485 [Bacteroides sp.]|nr:hypothetical protein [Bacteroides sp.]